MDADRTSQALARIDAAIARIEAAGRRAGNAGAELKGLQGRHDRLRQAVQESLDQLDQLIEGAQG